MLLNKSLLKFKLVLLYIVHQLSKVFFDWGMLWHLAWHYPEPVPTELHSILIPSVVASLPYLIRARQCLVMYTIGFLKVRNHAECRITFCLCLNPNTINKITTIIMFTLRTTPKSINICSTPSNTPPGKYSPISQERYLIS